MWFIHSLLTNHPLIFKINKMERHIEVVEKNVFAEPMPGGVVTLNSNGAISLVIPDTRRSRSEVVKITLFNNSPIDGSTTQTRLAFAIGLNKFSGVNYYGTLSSGQHIDIYSRQAVYCMALDGTAIDATYLMYVRRDTAQDNVLDVPNS